MIHSGGTGYDVKTSASGTLDFRAAAAMNNAQDGFAIEHDSGISRAQFLNCTSVKNGGDGYDVAGPRVDVLCSESFQNVGRGIEAGGMSSTSTLQVEVSHLKDNTAEGIHAAQMTANILSDTLDQNSNGGVQISNGQTLNIFDTIANGNVFVSSPPSNIHRGYNMYKIANACNTTPNANAPGTPGSIKATPDFVDGARKRLRPGTSGVGNAVPLPTALAGLSITPIVAQNKDGTGLAWRNPRDIGAYVAATARASTPTGQPTRTRTPTRTVTPTRTRTVPTPPATRTATPTIPNPCTADCDHDGGVEINEIITAVNIALMQQPVSSCEAADANHNGNVTIDELNQAVVASLLGCSAMGGVITGDLNEAAVDIAIGSALGNPGNTVEFTVDLVNSAFQVGGVSVDLVFLADQLTWPDCEIDPDVAAQGFRMVSTVTDIFGAAGVERLTLTQADQNAGDMTGLLCPGPRMIDGTLARCTAQILGGAPIGYFNWIDIGTSQVTDCTGGPFNTVLQRGMIVVNGTALPDAQFVSQSVPTSMTAGQQYTVSVTMQNTGGKVWTATPLSQQYSLGVPNGFGDTDIWNVPLNRVSLPSGTAVSPGQQYTFTFTVTAPQPSYNNQPFDFYWQTVRDGQSSTSWFGDTSPTVQVQVACGACGCS